MRFIFNLNCYTDRFILNLRLFVDFYRGFYCFYKAFYIGIALLPYMAFKSFNNLL